MWRYVFQYRLEHRAYGSGGTVTGGIAQTDLVAAHIKQSLRYLSLDLGVYIARVRTGNHNTNISSCDVRDYLSS